MNATTLEKACALTGWQAEIDVLLIYTELQQVHDARRNQGKRYPLALVLTSLLLAKAAGETAIQAISEWIRLRRS